MDYENFKKDILDFIQDNINAEIDIINSVKTDYEVPYIDEYVLNEYPNPIKYGKALTCYVQVGESIIELYSNKSKIIKNEIVLSLLASQKPDEELYKIIDRYVEAIFNLLNNNSSMGGIVNIAYVTKIQPYDGYETMANIIPIQVYIDIILYT